MFDPSLASFSCNRQVSLTKWNIWRVLTAFSLLFSLCFSTYDSLSVEYSWPLSNTGLNYEDALIHGCFSIHTARHNLWSAEKSQMQNDRYRTWARAEFAICDRFWNPSLWDTKRWLWSHMYKISTIPQKIVKTNKEIQQTSRLQNQWAKINCTSVH